MKNSRFSYVEIYELVYISLIIANIILLFFTGRKLCWVLLSILVMQTLLTYKITKELNKFIKKERKYTKFFILEAKVNLIVASIIFMSGLSLGYLHNFGFQTLPLEGKVVITIVYMLTSIIAGMRYYDIKTSYNSDWLLADKEVKVGNFKNNCLNGRYCKIFMDKETDVKFDIDRRYKIKYLSGTLGLYVIEAKEVEEKKLKITIDDFELDREEK